jgi:hypothetical protein
MSFLGGVFTGSAPGVNAAEDTASGVSGFGTGVGEGAVSTGLGFEEGLLSGNQGEEAQLLAPEISNIQKEGQQQIQTAGEFGNRSGGTNASAQNNIDTQRKSVNDMVAQLTGQAATGVTTAGENLINTGLTASTDQAQEAQQELDNQKNSLLGQGITGAADYAESFLPVAHGG